MKTPSAVTLVAMILVVYLATVSASACPLRTLRVNFAREFIRNALARFPELVNEFGVTNKNPPRQNNGFNMFNPFNQQGQQQQPFNPNNLNPFMQQQPMGQNQQQMFPNNQQQMLPSNQQLPLNQQQQQQQPMGPNQQQPMGPNQSPIQPSQQGLLNRQGSNQQLLPNPLQQGPNQQGSGQQGSNQQPILQP